MSCLAYRRRLFHFAVSLGWGAVGENPHSRAIFECFKLRGLFLRPDAADVVAAQLRREPDPDAALRVIASKIEDDRRGGGGVLVDTSWSCCSSHALPRAAAVADSIVSADAVRAALAESTRDEEDLRREASVLLPATRQPRFKYDAARRLYY